MVFHHEKANATYTPLKYTHLVHERLLTRNVFRQIYTQRPKLHSHITHTQCFRTSTTTRKKSISQPLSAIKFDDFDLSEMLLLCKEIALQEASIKNTKDVIRRLQQSKIRYGRVYVARRMLHKHTRIQQNQNRTSTSFSN